MAFSLFKKKKEQSDDRFLTLTVKEVNQIAKDSINIVFENPGEFSYKPGQFITLIREVNEKKIRRAYSLSSTPFEDEHPAVTVKRVNGGAMSNDLNDHLKAGDSIEIMEPMGMFTTEFNADNRRHAVFFGGGSGITPLISIIRSLLIKEPNTSIGLVYANRSEEYIIFKDLIDDLASKFADRLKVIHILENGDAEFTGRLNKEMIAEINGKLGTNDSTEFYICGPQPLMDIVQNSLSTSGFDDSKIKMESFEAGKTSPKSIIAQDATESEVSISLDGEDYSITVKRSDNILDAALDKDLDMPYSCQSGLCTACRGKCIEGEISIDEAEGLSQDELDEGYVLLCVGKPLSDKIRVEVG